ncbi:MAG: oxygenase MpaB family protein [Candidatus Limnocylindrales bacterium]
MLTSPLESLRVAVVRRTTGLFAFGNDPMARTMDYAGDPGLFGPDSITWEVMGDVSGFVAGIRALLIQAAHPEVVAGVADHSRYREDPLGRLSRTSDYVTATSYGAMPEVEQAVRIVRAAHRRVVGISHRGQPYRADDPSLAAWVHNSLTDSFLACHRAYGARALNDAEADRFVSEQARIGRLLDADPVPETAAELSAWVAEHPAVAPSPGMREAVMFLRQPPLDPAVLVGYQVLASAAVVTVPPRIRAALALRPRPGARYVGLASTRAMRWALASSPRWRQALLRVGAPIDERRFKQKVPFESLEAA